MESKCSEKCDPNEKLLAISNRLLPIQQILAKMQDTKSTVGAVCKKNNDRCHNLLVPYKTKLTICQSKITLYWRKFVERA